ncbi:MAG: hypothetical protein QGG97_03760 [Flavobacteriales bacterium]|nr:hypothetical protein [Flavobacteriales bacterium]
MKKLLYTFLAVSIIFAACKKEEENNNPPTSPASIVGKWTATNVTIDSTLIVSYMGQTIDSLSSSGSRTLTPQILGSPTDLEFLSSGTVYASFSDFPFQDTTTYTLNGNVLIIDNEGGFHYTVTNSTLALTGGEEFTETDTVDFGNGPMAIEMYYLHTNTLNFTKNTSGITNNSLNQRIGNPNHSWFTKPKLPNILKNIK